MNDWNRTARRIRVPLGFALAGLYVWQARPTLLSLGVGTLFVAAGVGIRAAASGHVRKNEDLATTGPYAYTRNPLYLGSIVLAVGFAVAARSPWIGVAMVALFLAIYLPVIGGEEAFLRERFPEYEAYARSVPRLFPRLLPARQAGVNDTCKGGFSRQLYMQHREYNASIGAAVMLAVLTALLWFR